ncbi:hypothetical protein MTQ01_10260 [Streptomyces sp. XM4193]|uniref:hypothetical protein n=1 Tax=Streptomyces sp. XM4193 TaxID=2929782 RepID=UPI001FFB326A|nr:hypothetical protein [Streptomyces sp. XM4193]MCK1796383.1 hypothetical protein [Streptomyces sp. XM4193]
MGARSEGPAPGPQPAFRAARAAVFTAVCVTLSAGTHVLLSGVPVPLIPLCAVALVVFACSYALAGRERGFWPIAALFLPLQLAADTVFTTGQLACYGTAGGPVVGPLRSMGVHLICTGGEFGTPLARLAADQPAGAALGHHPAAPWLLLSAHIVVGLLAAGWLWRGEQALRELLVAAVAEAVQLVSPLFRLLFGTTTPTPRRHVVRTAHRPRLSGALPLLVHSVVRRGPPAQFALCA